MHRYPSPTLDMTSKVPAKNMEEEAAFHTWRFSDPEGLTQSHTIYICWQIFFFLPSFGALKCKINKTATTQKWHSNSTPPCLPLLPQLPTSQKKHSICRQVKPHSLFHLDNNNLYPHTNLVDAFVFWQVNHTVLLLTNQIWWKQITQTSSGY